MADTSTLTEATRREPSTTDPAIELTGDDRPLWQRSLGKVVNADTGITLLSLVLIVAIWVVVGAVGDIPAYILPTPLEVLDSAKEFHGVLWDATLATAMEVVVGFAVAVAVAIPLAICIAFSRVIERLVYPITVGAQSVPKVAIAPIFLVWFGFGTTPKVLIAALIAFFPVVIDTVVGLRSIDPDMVHMAKVSGARGTKIFFKLRVPFALPSVFSGLKVAITLAVTGAVVGEFVAGTTGLGYVIQSAQGLQQTDLAFSAIIILAVLSLVFFYALEFLERILIKGAD